jgi:hypothetical protein
MVSPTLSSSLYLSLKNEEIWVKNFWYETYILLLCTTFTWNVLTPWRIQRNVNMNCSLFCDVTQRTLVVSYRRFGTISILKGQTVQEEWPIGCPGTSVTNYQSTLRNDPKERKTYWHLYGNLKPLSLTVNALRVNCLIFLSPFNQS